MCYAGNEHLGNKTGRVRNNLNGKRERMVIDMCILGGEKSRIGEKSRKKSENQISLAEWSVVS